MRRKYKLNKFYKTQKPLVDSYVFIDFDNPELRLSEIIRYDFSKCDVSTLNTINLQSFSKESIKSLDDLLQFSKLQYLKKDDRWIFSFSRYALKMAIVLFHDKDLQKSLIYFRDSFNLMYLKYKQYLGWIKNMDNSIEKNESELKILGPKLTKEPNLRGRFDYLRNKVSVIHEERAKIEKQYVNNSAKFIKQCIRRLFKVKSLVLLEENGNIDVTTFRHIILSSEVPYKEIVESAPKVLLGSFEELSDWSSLYFLYPKIQNDFFSFRLLTGDYGSPFSDKVITKCLQLRFNVLFDEISNDITLSDENISKRINEAVFCKEKLAYFHAKLNRPKRSDLALAESVWLNFYLTDDKKRISNFYNKGLSLFKDIIKKYGQNKYIHRKISLLEPRKYERLAQVSKEFKNKILYYSKANLCFSKIKSHRSYLTGFLRDYFKIINFFTKSMVSKGVKTANTVIDRLNLQLLKDKFPEIRPYICIVEFIATIPLKGVSQINRVDFLKDNYSDLLKSSNLEIDKWYRIIYAYNLLFESFNPKLIKTIFNPLLVELVSKDDGALRSIARLLSREILSEIMSKEKSNDYLIEPDDPFGNKSNFGKIIRSCTNYLWWVDRYITREGLELLYEFLNKDEINEVKILTTGVNINNNTKAWLVDFQKSLENKGINFEFRVMSKELVDKVHDRWIISLDICYSVQSPNTIYKGQYSEMKLTEYRPPFMDWWSKSPEINKT